MKDLLKITIEKFIQTFIGEIFTYQSFNTVYPNEVGSTTLFDQEASSKWKVNQEIDMKWKWWTMNK